MTFRPDQVELCRDIRDACVALGHPAAVIAAECAVMAECSCDPLIMTGGDISAATGQPSTSVGPYQQTEAWAGLVSVRLDPYRATALFLLGGQGGQRGYLGTDPARPVTSRVQDVQGSQYDGVTAWPGRAGAVYPFAQNYVDALPDALAILRQTNARYLVSPWLPG